jgi:hypothetical protein
VYGSDENADPILAPECRSGPELIYSSVSEIGMLIRFRNDINTNPALRGLSGVSSGLDPSMRVSLMAHPSSIAQAITAIP